MLSYQQAVSIGMGQRTDPDLFAARKALTWRERQRAMGCVRRGEAAWDEPSARFAAASARSVMRQPMVYGKRGTQVAVYLIVLVFIVQAVVSIADEAVVRSIFFTGFGAWFAILAYRFPSTVRNAPRAYERNVALLGPDAHAAAADLRPSRAEVWGSRVFAALAVGSAFGVATAVIDDTADSVGGIALRSVIFGVFMVTVSQWAARRRERKDAREAMEPAEPQHH